MTFAGKLLTFCAAGAMLAACGGGDDKKATGRDIAYTGSTAAVVISQSNVTSMAALASESVSGSVGAASGGPGYAAAASLDRQMGTGTALAKLRAARGDFAAAFAGVVQGTATKACPGGGAITLTMFAASDTVTTTGDWFELSFGNCVEADGSTANGTLRMEITASDGVDPSDVELSGPGVLTDGFTYGMRLTVTDFSIEDATGWFGLEGDVELTQTWNATTLLLSAAMQGSSLVSVSGVGSTVVAASAIKPLTVNGRYSMAEVGEYASAFATAATATRSSIDARVCSVEMGGCINLDTLVPVRQVATQLYPDSGSLKVFDDAGHYIQIDITPGSGATGAVTMSWEVVVGAPTPDGTCSATWPTLSTACSP